nr:GIY-YIG nuclease family protein [uncultured Hyphomonas sp.]
MNYAFVYILASQRNGTLYTGVTSNLETRIWQHRHDVFTGFSRKYDCKTLVWYECHDDINEAILREKRIKRWHRRWKLDLIEADNPAWQDLYPQLLSVPPSSILPDTALLGPG